MCPVEQSPAKHLADKRKFYKNYWKNDELRNIRPDGLGEFPEGWDVRAYLKELTARLPHDSLVDFGCGYGRLCRAFAPQKYLGIDLNPNAVKTAAERFPTYSFQEADFDHYPPADIYLAYTVFLHLDDEVLAEVLTRMAASCRKYLIIAEILGREWRRPGTPPVFNRDQQDYVSLASAAGFRLAGEDARPYRHYQSNPQFADRNTDLNVLIFENQTATDHQVGNGVYQNGMQSPGESGSIRSHQRKPENAMDLAIYGMMRSGTTFLADKLTSQPSAFVLTEPNMHLNDWGTHTLRQLQAFGIHVDESEWDRNRWPSFEVFFDTRILPELSRLEFWGVKLVNFANWPYFFNKYQPKRLILCVREIRDVVLSAVELAATQERSHVLDSKWITNRAVETARELVRMSRLPHLLVRYEDLCTDPTVMRRILDYTGLTSTGDERIGLDSAYRRRYEHQRHGSALSSRTVYSYCKGTRRQGRELAEHVWQQCAEYCTTFGYEAPRRHVSLDSSVIECHPCAKDVLLGPHAGQSVPITRTAAGENPV